MKKLFIQILMVFVFVIYNSDTSGWGFFAHEQINRLAVYTLPPEMIGFYKKNIDYITSEATRPDKRRYAIKEEAARHYIDIDHYGESPFEIVPRKWRDATEKFSEDTLQAYGILPWHVNLMIFRLTDAFKANDTKNILKISTELGHYIGDAHVPLHTTENYNGQLTGQHGIHGFWESRIPELYFENYDFLVGRAEYIDKPADKIWEIVQASFNAKDSVLLFESKLRKEFPSDQVYSYEQRGASNIKTYSQDYSSLYNKMLDGMVERRMQASVINLGSFWFTAWVNAGQPNLDELKISPESVEKEKEEISKLEKLFQVNKIFGREHDN